MTNMKIDKIENELYGLEEKISFLSNLSKTLNEPTMEQLYRLFTNVEDYFIANLVYQGSPEGIRDIIDWFINENNFGNNKKILKIDNTEYEIDSIETFCRFLILGGYLKWLEN